MGRVFRRRMRKKKYGECHEELGSHISLIKWCSSHTLDTNCLRPFHFAGSGRGMQTTKPVNSGDLLVKIPKALIITTSTALSDPVIKSALSRSAMKPSADELLSVYLLLEKSRGDKSFWHEYIKSLPKSFTNLLYINPDDVICLDANLRMRHKRMKTDMQSRYDDVFRIFSPVIEFTYSDFLWAWHVVNTRSFHMEQPVHEEIHIEKEGDDKYALTPFLDMINHSDCANCRFSYNEVTESYEIMTSDSYRPYDEVYIKYGAHNNRTLLSVYGFCVRGNSHSEIAFELDEVIEGLYDGTGDDSDGSLQQMWCINITSDFFISNAGLSRNFIDFLNEALEIIEPGYKTEQDRQSGFDRLKKRFLHSVISLRKHYLQLLDASCSQRTDVERFILSMLKVLYEDEIETLLNATYEKTD